jgi:acyl carrier protein
MEQTLRNIVAKIAEIPPDFAPDASLRDDLKVDSVRALELLFEVEKELAVAVPETRYGEVRTFQDLVKLVRSLKAA